jgi:hypothetical protein
MSAARRQAMLLIALLGLLAAVVAYQMGVWTPADRGGAASNPLAANGTTGAVPQVVDVQLERLGAREETFTPPRRDPFRFRARLAPPPPPPVTRPTVRTVPAGPPPPPPVPPIPLKFIGLAVLPEGTRVAVLSDGTARGTLYGRQGDVIDGRYRLLRVENDSIEMAYLDGSGRRRIPKTGQ